uniref:Uncharacterized protein n=1 Tax=Rhizophora mucronata TaxID=61149 RepID=A0A2P2QIF2_RHIMU
MEVLIFRFTLSWKWNALLQDYR